MDKGLVDASVQKETPRAARSVWHWLRWVLLLAGACAGFAACAWIATVHPKKDVLPFEQHYPRLNPHPSRPLTVTGTLPEKLQIIFIAYYAAAIAPFNNPGDASCYRSIPLGPAIPLHLSESLKTVRRGSYYEVSVLSDKYEAGACGWSLAAVTYRVPNSLDDELRASEPGWYGTTIAYSVGESAKAANDDNKKYWRGRVDIWCLNETTAQSKKNSEACGVLGGFSHDYTSLVPADEGATNASTVIFPETRVIDINFHDLNALIDRGVAK